MGAEQLCSVHPSGEHTEQYDADTIEKHLLRHQI